MKYNPDKHHRKSIRLKDYDYSQSGAYFVTICAHNRKCLFGQINEGKMILNGFANIIHNEWMKTGQIRENTKLDEFVIMPNHLHGIIFISNDDRRGVLQYAPTNEFRSPSQTIGSIIRGFKSTTTKQINKSRNTPRLPLWQRNYYEHVIRNDDDLNDIREYIINNPLKWDIDKENPNNTQKKEHK